jgi:hypothetical protein
MRWLPYDDFRGSMVAKVKTLLPPLLAIENSGIATPDGSHVRAIVKADVRGNLVGPDYS